MDPLGRSEETESKKPTYYRGFFDAEKRRKVANIELTAGQTIMGSFFAALPFGILFYFFVRQHTWFATQMAKGPAKGGLLDTMRKSMQGMMNPMGNKDFRVSVKDTKFKDVVGIPEALAEVQQYVNFLKTPEKFTRLGGRLPKGCLLTGQPGTGKTLLAKAVAGEADVPFFSCSGADFIEVHAGSGPKRVRDIFQEAKKNAPAVIFIDEIDAVGSRSSGNGALGLSSEENRTINQLLAELDGLQANEAIVVFAATNFMESLDKAMLREGRFDRKVEIPMPDKEARESVFRHYLSKVVSVDPEGEARCMAELTPGVSPATIAAIVNEAALSAAVADKAAVTHIDLLPSIDDVLVGKKHRNRMSEAAARRVALHESGHTLVAWLLREQSAVIKVSITPRGAAAGFTQQVGREVLDMPTEFSLFTDICVMLGGRLAELTQYDNLTTGAQDDYQRATKCAMNAFLAFGMSPQVVGLLAVEPQRLDEGRMAQKHSEDTQCLAEREAARLVGAAYTFVQKLLNTHDATLKKLASELFARKELLHEDLEAIIGPRSDCGGMEVTGAARKALANFTKASEEAALKKSTSRDSIIEGLASARTAARMQPMSQQRPAAAATPAYDKMAYQVIYPQYMDSTLIPSQGRRLTKTQSINHPTLEEMLIALRELGYTNVIVDRAKSLPRSQGTNVFPVVPRGCILVAIKEPASEHYIKKSDFDTQIRGVCIAGIESKQELLRRIAANIKTKGNPRPELPTAASIVSSITGGQIKGKK